MFSIFKNKIQTITLVVAALSCSSAAFAQSESTLRNPLIPGAAAEPPGAAPNPGQVPAVGTGSVPTGVTPGTLNPPTLLPSVPTLPSNNIDVTNSNPGIPFSPSMTSAPGQLGQMLGPSIPAPPSNPGVYPGSIIAPMGTSQQTMVNPQGGLPGVGGFAGSQSAVRRSGQTTQQFEYRGRPSVLGQGSPAAGGIQDEVTRLGSQSGYGLPYGVPSGTKNYTRNSSIDLGGGARVKQNGVTTSNGSSVADYGLSVVRTGANSAGISAQQANDFGQGRRNQTTIQSNKTTDFGFPYMQFNPANETAQKTGQRMSPTAVITNF